MSIVLYDAIGRAVILPAGMKLEWDWHSWAAVGGPDEMEVTVTALEDSKWEPLRWLGWEIRALNELGAPVWWGLIEEAEGMAGPALPLVLSLSDVANRVQVIYTYEDAAGSLGGGGAGGAAP